MTATVKTLDHLVLTCSDVAATVAFYTTHLGMRATEFVSPKDADGAVRRALHFGTQKINLHQRGAEFEPKAQTALPGTADLCFEVADEVRLEDVQTRLKADGGVRLEEEGEIVYRTGAKGRMRSLYVRDPDGNLIE
ncbi:hypothetical protein MY4038_008619 [Beauveria bassiana]|uniref:Glyoxalase domain-containing protein 5 n=2 Tax=Beauveria bassiana TaxID=176275 RepID=A0A0A2VAT2_BEABA|nr:Glyoxalase domain-containing protein 5 [Beauveria bassiana D1-5]PQK13079.1 hypothetical protein BB8028_0004g00110 [Beauveria bassiana]